MEPSRRPGVVFDCNVFLQALANERSAAAKALDLLEQDAITLFVGEPILREVRDVLTRTKIRRKLPRITNVRVRALLQRLIAKAILIKNIPEEFKYQRDPKDEMYINLAIVANAEYLVSRDQDLLDLVTTSTDVARQFRSRYPFLRIIKAADFITEMEDRAARSES